MSIPIYAILSFPFCVSYFFNPSRSIISNNFLAYAVSVAYVPCNACACSSTVFAWIALLYISGSLWSHLAWYFAHSDGDLYFLKGSDLATNLLPFPSSSMVSFLYTSPLQPVVL